MLTDLGAVEAATKLEMEAGPTLPSTLPCHRGTTTVARETLSRDTHATPASGCGTRSRAGTACVITTPSPSTRQRIAKCNLPALATSKSDPLTDMTANGPQFRPTPNLQELTL